MPKKKATRKRTPRKVAVGKADGPNALTASPYEVAGATSDKFPPTVFDETSTEDPTEETEQEALADLAADGPDEEPVVVVATPSEILDDLCKQIAELRERVDTLTCEVVRLKAPVIPEDMRSTNVVTRMGRRSQ